jgi:hypothetical protein
LSQITHHNTNVDAYSFNGSGDQVVFVADERAEKPANRRAPVSGIVVPPTAQLVDLIGLNDETATTANELYFQWRKSGRKFHKVIKLPEGTEIPSWQKRPWLSPDGRYALISTRVAKPPSVWQQYLDPTLHEQLQQHVLPGEFYWLTTYLLVDMKRAKTMVLLNSPVRASAQSESVWSPNSRSVVISNMLLPLDDVGSDEQSVRRATAFTVEVSVPRREIVTVTTDDLRLLNWDVESQSLLMGSRILFRFGTSDMQKKEEGAITAFQKSHGVWHKLPHQPPTLVRPEIIWQEHLNSPPRIVAIDPLDGHESLLFDPNPQFQELTFGKVEEIRWPMPDGQDMRGGLVFPVGYEQGKRYPLVIQTHGWIPDTFLMDGPPATTGYAAQPLAGKGIMVLQVDLRIPNDLRAELDTSISALEGAIDDLDRRGLIDRTKVGLIGFSRTASHVKYMLTHSTYPIAAASVTDGIDDGYFQYIAFSHGSPAVSQVFEDNVGDSPFGAGLDAWLKKSPSFNVAKVNTPLLITALNRGSVLTEWEWFVALSRMKKAVELVVLRDASHIARRPLDRMVTEQNNVDWFCFWLKGEEDPSPEKTSQYQRWKMLANLGSSEVQPPVQAH